MDVILLALEWYLDARQDLDKCRDSCEYDAGYFCSSQYAAVESAKGEIDKALGAYVNARIVLALASALPRWPTRRTGLP